MTRLAKTPVPPYYAVIFTSELSDDTAGYAELAQRMVELAQQQPGFLGFESARDSAALGITVSYWSSRAAIAAWKQHGEHLLAQRLGHRQFYRTFHLRIAVVESESRRGSSD